MIATDNVAIFAVLTEIPKNRLSKLAVIVNGLLIAFAEPCSSRALDALLKNKSNEINVVLALEVSEEELVKRLLGRGLTSGRSDDTNETIIRARIQEYNDKTTAVATYYAQFNKVVAVKGEGTVESIYADLKAEIDTRIN